MRPIFRLKLAGTFAVPIVVLVNKRLALDPATLPDAEFGKIA